MLIKDSRTKRTFDFNIRGIIMSYMEKNEEDQIAFIKMKLRELEEIGNLKLNWINRMKRRHLLQRNNIGFVLNGLLFEVVTFR